VGVGSSGFPFFSYGLRASYCSFPINLANLTNGIGAPDLNSSFSTMLFFIKSGGGGNKRALWMLFFMTILNLSARF